jgi:hypothetical protein
MQSTRGRTKSWAAAAGHQPDDLELDLNVVTRPGRRRQHGAPEARAPEVLIEARATYRGIRRDRKVMQRLAPSYRHCSDPDRIQGATSFHPGPGSNIVILAPMAVESLPRFFS